MTTHLRFARAAVALLALGLLVQAGVSATQKPASSSRPAAARVPIGFDDYHGYTGTIDYLKKVATAYPGITDLVEIGRTTMGRPIVVLVITNMKTGVTIDSLVRLRNVRLENGQPVKNVTPMKPYQGKPGIWIDGGTHGNEYTGTEVCLYIVDRLVSGYGSDPDLSRLVDDNTFYICPVVNPDGVFNSVEKGVSQRGNSMAADNDGDGKVNEDGPDDLDGDGVIRQFRYKDEKGPFVLSEADPRVMVRLGPNETTTRPRYSVVTEDKDNDGDGKRGEDGESGIDVNRNFPEGWYRDDQEQGGTGAYPSSSPEARAVLEFFTNHTNILFVQSFHTSGGFTYRPMARWPDARMDARDVAVYDRVIGRRYLELIGEPVPAAWADPRPTAGEASDWSPEAQLAGVESEQGRQPAARVRQAGTAAGGQQAGPLPRGFRHPYNDERRAPYGYGVFLDWAYAQFGSWSMSTELWNWQKDSKGLPGFAGENDRAKWEIGYLAYQEKALGGRAFKPWTAFRHPELGDGEIGGWTSKYGPGNAIPGPSLAAVCETHWQFERFKATLLPKVGITGATARVLYTTNDPGAPLANQQGDTVTITKGQRQGRFRIVEVKVALANDGQLPTHVGRGAALRGNRDDVVWLLGDRDRVTFLQGTPWVRLGTLPGTLQVPGVPPTAPPGEIAVMGGRGGGGGFFQGGAPIEAQLRLQRPAPSRVASRGNAREVIWLVAVDGDTPLKVVLSSQKGGTVVRELVIN